ncbi:MAG: peptidylprolyl isomerase [Anaerolineaceae bacterium]|nr:peptidylprolyl isomerase [Anaerolineaceae bacterium]
MSQAKSGDNVKLHYTGTLNDGTVFDSSQGREPLEFTLGQNQVIPGFENAVVGMEPGESKTVNIPADQAYGPQRDDMILEVSPEEFPPDVNPKVGDRLQIRQSNGATFHVTVQEITDTSVKLDGNHPLAGQDLTFQIELVEIAS